MSELISIVVPVYNVEKYLEECINSILLQSYEHFELLLIDDGSTDQSGHICDNYVNRDNRVIVFHKENGGLSDARNYGRKHCNGKYITYIDSDDTISKDYLKLLYESIVEYDADIVQGRMIKNKNLLDKKVGKVEIFTNIMALKSLFLKKSIYVSSCAKLYKTEVIHNIDFPKGKINEDALTTYKFLYNSKKVISIPYNIYWHRMREGSIMHSKYNSNRLYILNVPNFISQYIGKDSKVLEEELEYYDFRLNISAYNALMLETRRNEYLEEKNKIKNRLLSSNRNNQYMQLKYHAILFIMKLSEKKYILLLKIQLKWRHNRHE